MELAFFHDHDIYSLFRQFCRHHGTARPAAHHHHLAADLFVPIQVGNVSLGWQGDRGSIVQPLGVAWIANLLVHYAPTHVDYLHHSEQGPNGLPLAVETTLGPTLDPLRLEVGRQAGKGLEVAKNAGPLKEPHDAEKGGSVEPGHARKGQAQVSPEVFRVHWLPQRVSTGKGRHRDGVQGLQASWRNGRGREGGHGGEW